MRSNAIRDLLQNNQAVLRNYGVSRLGLFGSFSRNEQTDESDIDFLVEFYPNEKTFENFMLLAEWLEHQFQRRIELITPQSLSPSMRSHILAEVQDVFVAN